MALLDDVKLALRVTESGLDGEIQGLIDAARADLRLSGVIAEKAEADDDPLIKRAIVTYCRAHFDVDDWVFDRLIQSYEMLKAHLTLSREYGFHAATFTVTDGANPLEDARITCGAETMDTDSAGRAIFYVRAQQNLPYTVVLEGYRDVSGTVDVTGATAVAVTMEAV